ncbi:phage tail sheath subtilisin-like domain-containing protein [Acetanaerobacterium elongatum]|uniref:Phage tail sheath protein n=1 Tax=Acetanaerobacterium elongatum TaxID=258515 RepID=A0A1G9Z1Q3_9FIRM|nr:phage tail sheath subtilisin-like domain-containing protein [Acetanaerobacterium elongatum]SDN15224.1 Phage tail sheath protein [Acetanaerobacterium elongatum]
MIQNQILPGVYINVVAGKRGEDVLGVRGIATIPLELDWGAQITELAQGENPFPKLGYLLSAAPLVLVKEILNYATKLIIYRINNGEKAQATLAEGITAKARYAGTRGNSLSVIVAKDGSVFVVKTFMDTLEVDTQIISKPQDFIASNYIELEGTGSLVNATVTLTGGTNGTVSSTAYDDYLTALELLKYNVITYTGSDNAVKSKIAAFVKRMRDEGVRVQAVMNGFAADYEGIINNTIGGISGGVALTAAQTCATRAGIEAMLGITASGTNMEIIGWTDVNPRLNRIQLESRTKNGESLFVIKDGKVKLLYDINSLTTFTEEKPKDFAKNLVIRTLDAYVMDLQALLDEQAIGKLRNNVNGRNQLKGMIVDMTKKRYLETESIEDFTADDVVVEIGTERDSVVAHSAIKVVDTMDKIYLTVVSR